MSVVADLNLPIRPVAPPVAEDADGLAALAVSLILSLRREVSGQTLGLVGFGPVARAVARRAGQGLGMQVLVFSHGPLDQAMLDAVGATRAADLDTLLRKSDVVSLHSAEPIKGAQLDLMQDHAILVNVGANKGLDQKALAHGLMFGCLGGAGLAVAGGERINPLLAQCETLVTACPPDLAP
mgnify:CR=1 FL=1